MARPPGNKLGIPVNMLKSAFLEPGDPTKGSCTRLAEKRQIVKKKSVVARPFEHPTQFSQKSDRDASQEVRSRVALHVWPAICRFKKKCFMTRLLGFRGDFLWILFNCPLPRPCPLVCIAASCPAPLSCPAPFWDVRGRLLQLIQF